MTKYKKIIKNISIVFLSIILSIAYSEVILKLLKIKKWETVEFKNEPVVYEFDSILGWTNRAGSYEFPSYDNSGKIIRMTFFHRGDRRTYENQGETINLSPKIIVLGGSFTQGWAISDYETYPWTLQKKNPDFEILNYGTGGYGTYQSLLTLERVLPNTYDPRIVIYGFIEDHENRNVASAKWLEGLCKLSRRGHVFVPYATIDRKGMLRRHQPATYPLWPLRERLAIVTLAQKAFIKIKAVKRVSCKKKITKKILLEMNEICNKNQILFAVVLLYCNKQTAQEYMSFGENNGLKVIDCVYPLTEEMKVTGEGHPNGNMNLKWGQCISEFLHDFNSINQ